MNILFKYKCNSSKYIFIFLLLLLFCSCSTNKNNNKNKSYCDSYIINTKNNSINELDFTNKIKQRLKEKLNILTNNGRNINSCKLTFGYKIISHNSNISNSGDVSEINRKIILSFNLRDNENTIILKDKILEFFSIQSSDYKYIEMTNQNKIYETKIESIVNKIIMSIERNLI